MNISSYGSFKTTSLNDPLLMRSTISFMKVSDTFCVFSLGYEGFRTSVHMMGEEDKGYSVHREDFAGLGVHLLLDVLFVDP